MEGEEGPGVGRIVEGRREREGEPRVAVEVETGWKFRFETKRLHEFSGTGGERGVGAGTRAWVETGRERRRERRRKREQRRRKQGTKTRRRTERRRDCQR